MKKPFIFAYAKVFLYFCNLNVYKTATPINSNIKINGDFVNGSDVMRHLITQ